MKIDLYSAYPKQECISRLDDKINKYYNYYETGFYGKVNQDRFEYYYHVAYFKNSFNKIVLGRLSEYKNGTRITLHITNFFYARWYIFLAITLFGSVLMAVVNETANFPEAFKAGLSTFIVFTIFFIVLGLITYVINLSGHSKKFYVEFIMKTLDAKVIE